MTTTTKESSEIILKGGCYCGSIHYTVKPSALPTTHTFCHCRTCQQISGSAFLPFVGFPASQVAITSTPPDALRTFAASEFADRQFCGLCGSTLSMRYHANAARIALVVASFDAESVRLLPPGPTQHIYVDEKAGWLALGAEEDGVARCATMDRAAEYVGGRQRQSG